MCAEMQHLKDLFITQITVSFFLRNLCTSLYDVQWVDLGLKTKRFYLDLSWQRNKYKNSLGSRLKVYMSLKLTKVIQRMS